MAAEYALIYLGVIDSLTEAPPFPTFPSYPSSADDFSYDVIIPSKMKSKLFYDFSRSKEEVSDVDMGRATERVKSTNEPIADNCDDDFPEELQDFGDDNILSQLIGKNPLTIIGEMEIEARYLMMHL